MLSVGMASLRQTLKFRWPVFGTLPRNLSGETEPSSPG